MDNKANAWTVVAMILTVIALGLVVLPNVAPRPADDQDLLAELATVLLEPLNGRVGRLEGAIEDQVEQIEALQASIEALVDDFTTQTYGCNVYTEQGCAKYVVASGGEIEVQSGGTLDVQSGATTDFSGGLDLDGALLDLDADGDTSIHADTDDQIDIEVSGADDFQITANTFSALSGSTIKVNTIAETTAASGVTIDSVVVKDGGILAAGTGLIDTAGITDSLVIDSDGDTTISAPTDDQVDIEVSGADDFQITANAFTALAGSVIDTNTLDDTSGGEIAVTAGLDLTGLMQWSFTDSAVSNGDTLTATTTVHALDTSGAVTITLAASADEGQLLVLINDDANATIIADTNIRTSDGNAITLAGAYDIVIFVYQDSEWLELLAIANS